jgi:hypothetical protein
VGSAARQFIIVVGLLAESDVDSKTRAPDTGSSESVGAFSRSSITPSEVHDAINCLGSRISQVWCDNAVLCISNSSFRLLYRIRFS